MIRPVNNGERFIVYYIRIMIIIAGHFYRVFAKLFKKTGLSVDYRVEIALHHVT